jgi:hypothetical protein
MKREGADVESGQREEQERERRKEALHVLLDARERLLSQMTEDILTNRDALLDGSVRDGFSSFELEEIEDRYSTRLHAINSLLENLEYRHPMVRHRIETVSTTLRHLKRDLTGLLGKFEEWDLVDLEILPAGADEVLVVAALTADEYPE